MVISNGHVTVPDVKNQDVATANNTLLALQLEVKTVADLSCSGGKVSSQSVVGDVPQRTGVQINFCNKP